MTVKQKIPQDFLDDLIARNDIVEWISERISLKRSGSNWHGKCPFHQEKSPSFSVSQTKQFYYCFGCKAAGNIIQFIMEYHHYTFLETVELLANAHGLSMPTLTGGKQENHQEDWALMQAIAKAYQQQLNKAPKPMEYLIARGLSNTTIKAFQLGFAPDEWRFVLNRFAKDPSNMKRLITLGMAIEKKNSIYDRFRGRIMFPIINHKGQVIAFGGRVLNQETPKYLNSPETPLFHKSDELFGLYHVRKQTQKISKILVVEGYMDVIALANHGIHYAVATLGTAITPGHLKKLLRQCDTIYFCFDGDLAGHTAAWKALTTALPHCHDGTHIFFSFLPEKEDPDSFVNQHGKDSFEEHLDKSLPLSTFFMEKLYQNHPPTSLDNKASLAKEAATYLKQMPEGIFKSLLYKSLSENVNISVEELKNPQAQPTQSRQPRPRMRPASQTKSSPIRQIITLLLHYPSIASKLNIDALSNDTTPGIPQLKHLMQILEKSPKIKSTGALLQHIEDPTFKKQLSQLAGQLIFTQGDEAAALAQALINQYLQSKIKHTIQGLIRRAEQGLLSSEEKSKLQQLITQQKKQN